MTRERNYPRAKVLGVLQFDHRLLVEEFEGEHSKGNGIYYRPLGGSIEFGERAIDALCREFEEELKETVKIEDFSGFLENIFMINDRVGHEIILVYNVSFEDKENYTRERFTIQENCQTSFAKWIDIKDFIIGEKVLFPGGLVDKLRGEIHEPTANE